MYQISTRRIVGGLLAILFSAALISSPPRLAAEDGPSPAPTTRAGHAVDPMPIPLTETIVIFRHGEKPANGLGQLTPQGLNRALGLSDVLPQKFGHPDTLFAPDPHEKVKDRGGEFYYIRPLATIEPLAIRLGMDVQTPFGFTEISKLDNELADAKYNGRVVFVAWEHVYARKATVELVKMFHGDTSNIPEWAGKDYDSLYVVKIRRALGHAPTATFTLEHEGLDNQSTTMPSPAAKP